MLSSDLLWAVACHCAVRAVDYFGEIVNAHGAGSTLENINIHRTKCAGLLKKLIAPSLKEDIVGKVSNNTKLFWVIE